MFSANKKALISRMTELRQIKRKIATHLNLASILTVYSLFIHLLVSGLATITVFIASLKPSIANW